MKNLLTLLIKIDHKIVSIFLQKQTLTDKNRIFTDSLVQNSSYVRGLSPFYTSMDLTPFIRP